MAKLKALTCPVCSAPLEVPTGASTVTCRYCQAAVQVQHGGPRTAPTPMPGAPPIVIVHGGGALRAGLVAAIVPLTVALGSAGYAVYRASGGGAGVRLGATSLPARCAVNGEITLSGQTFTGTGTLVEAATNCRVRIVDSTLTGDVIVKGGTNVHVTVEKSTLHAKESALDLELNGDVKLVDATFDGADVAVRGGTNLTIDATRAEVSAKSHAVEAAGNLKAVLRQCTFKSDEEAIRGDSGLDLTVEGGTIHGGDAAVRGEHNAKVRASKKARLEAKVAVQARANAEVTFEDATAFGDDVGFRVESNVKVRLAKGALVHGGRAAIEAGHNPSIEVGQATIESPATAVLGGYNAQIELRTGAVVKGGARAFALAGKPSSLSTGDAQVIGARVFDLRDAPSPAPAASHPPAPTRRVASGDPLALVPAAPTPIKMPPFETALASRLLTEAQHQAEAACRSSRGKPVMVFVNPRFTVDGVNHAEFSSPKQWTGTPEGACVLPFFERVKVPPFDWDTRVSGMGRAVDLK